MTPLLDFALFVLLILVGVVIVSLLKTIIFLLPAILVTLVVWFITGNLLRSQSQAY